MSNKHKARRTKQERPSRTPERLLAAGAVLGVAALLSGTPKGREIVGNAWNEEQAPAKAQSTPQEQEPKVILKYDQETDKALFGFADEHLQGDPMSHLDELHDQLPEGTPEGSYDVPDGWTFEVPASELDDPADEQIVGLADSATED